MEFFYPHSLFSAVDIHLLERALLAEVLVETGARQAAHADIQDRAYRIGVIDETTVMQLESLVFSSFFHPLFPLRSWAPLNLGNWLDNIYYYPTEGAGQVIVCRMSQRVRDKYWKINGLSVTEGN